MKISMISCWFATSYGAYTDSLRKALETHIGDEVKVVASNCGCGDPIEIRREFEDHRCDYFEQPHILYWHSDNPLKRWLRLKACNFSYRKRASGYIQRSGSPDVMHFFQTLNAYGSVSAFNWLNLPTKAARVITVHELDPYQTDYPAANLNYNKADRIIVHTNKMKEKLVALGVKSNLIDIVEHGVDVPADTSQPRSGLIYYGGHRVHVGKGLDTMFAALSIIKERLGPDTPLLSIHGHYGDIVPPYALELAQAAGVESNVRWLNQIKQSQVTTEYQKAMLCILPFTGSFAGYPAVQAMANGVPVIATKNAGLPEHLGDVGTWIEENDPEGLASAIIKLLTDNELRKDISSRGLTRVKQYLTWDKIALKTLESYKRANETKNTRI